MPLFNVANLLAAVGAMKGIIEHGPLLVQHLADFIDLITSTIDKNIAKLNALHDDSVDCGGWNKTVLRDLERVADKAYVYAGNVDQLYRYGGDKARNETIRKQLRCGDLTELNAYINQVQKCLVNCGVSYKATQEAIKELITHAEKGAGHCEKKAKEAKDKKNTTRVVGGAASSGALVAGVAGGVVASVVAGVFTFGIGTIVGLSLTAAGTSAATHGIALDFKKSETKFRNLQESFEQAQSRCLRIDNFINTLQPLVDLISTAVDNVTPIHTYQNTSALVTAFDCICEAYGDLNDEPTYRQRLMDMDSGLEARFAKLRIS